MASSDESAGRPVGRLDHITLAYQTRERQDAAREELSTLLGIDDWVEIDGQDLKLRMLMSWASGLELVSPTGPGSMLEEFLERHGEGVFGVVIGVPTLNDPLARFKEQGRDPLFVSTPSYSHVHERFESFRSALLGQVAGMRLVLGEYHLRADS